MAGDLDPADWQEFRETAHRVLDASLDKMQFADKGRVWSDMPEPLKAIFDQDLPMKGQSVEKTLTDLLPYGVGNTHPRFFGWVHGAGTPSDILADIIAQGMNVNAGGRNHVAPIVEKQVLRWCGEIMGMGQDVSGLITSGTSMATIIALKVARDTRMKDARKNGVPQGQLVGYASAQGHSCIKNAFDMLGLGADAVRNVPCNEAYEMDIPALEAAIKADLAEGLVPFCVIGTAGAVNMGAIDDLDAIAAICAQNKLWFHVDGAFGATAILAASKKDKLAALGKADSLAFDFHKWIQVNYEAGCILFKDRESHRGSFSNRPEYLRGSERGLSGGAFWAVDFGPELSRSFKALKVWTHFMELGVDRLAMTIERNIELAQYMKARILAEPKLEHMAPVPLNINCFRYRFDHDQGALNEELVSRMQERGVAVPSTTILKGELVIRANITNHRTQISDVDFFIDKVLEIGDELAA